MCFYFLLNVRIKVKKIFYFELLFNYHVIVRLIIKWLPTIYVYRITRPILIFVYIGRITIQPIQDSVMSQDFRWHVTTKVELSSANLALPIKHPKKSQMWHLQEMISWWMLLHIKRNTIIPSKQLMNKDIIVWWFSIALVIGPQAAVLMSGFSSGQYR